MTDREKYARYIASPEWARKRESVFLRAEYRCEVGTCRKPAFEVHHLTYERLYHERETDLIAVCMTCHDALTEATLPMGLSCLCAEDERKSPCECVVCKYARRAQIIGHQTREKLSRAVNRQLHLRLLRRYSEPEVAAKRYAGLARSEGTPSWVLCDRTGRPAGADPNCPCDTCVCFRSMEMGFRLGERDPE